MNVWREEFGTYTIYIYTIHVQYTMYIHNIHIHDTCTIYIQCIYIIYSQGRPI